MVKARVGNKTAGISDAAVEKATGRNWAAWIRLLDKAGAGKMVHKEIAAHLHKQEKLSAWWAQMVTVGYEQARGVRLPGQKPGGFDISKSKTINASCARAFAAWKDAARRRAWLEDGPLTVRSVTAGKLLRFNWIDGKTTLAISFYPKGRGKSKVVVQHLKLSGATTRERMKKYWAAALGRLAEYLEET